MSSGTGTEVRSSLTCVSAFTSTDSQLMNSSFLSVIFVGMVLNGCMFASFWRRCADGSDDGSLIAGLQAFDSWHEDLGHPNGTRIGLLNATGFLSGLVVGPIITYIDEHFGRKWGIRCELSPLPPLLD